MTLSPDGKTLYAVNAGANSIAVIPLHGEHAYRVSGPDPDRLRAARHHLQRRRPVDVHRQRQEHHRAQPRPPGQRHGARSPAFTYPGGNAAAAAAARASNQYQFQLERASLVSAPVPSSWELERLTKKVAENNFYDSEHRGDERRVVEFLRKHIKHVIYIVKENRTFDQILGDLGNGSNGDSSLTQFGESHHAELPPPGAPVRHARQLHGSGRRQHGRLVLEPCRAA